MAIVQVDRKFYWKRHLAVLFITLLILTIGILIGSILGEQRLEFTRADIEKQQGEYESLQMQLLYLTGQEEKNCEVLLNSLERNIYDLENSRVKLEGYILGSEGADFNTVKRDYILTEIRYWLMASEAKKVCPSESVSVLFFYKMDEACSDCSAQGHVLTYLKNIFGEKLLVFSLDVDFDEPMVQILKENYALDKLPSLVINDKVFEGLVKKEELINELCSHYGKDSFEVCRNS